MKRTYRFEHRDIATAKKNKYQHDPSTPQIDSIRKESRSTQEVRFRFSSKRFC